MILIGADPELFVKKSRSFISGHDLIPGTKEQPFKVPKGAIQVDGTAVEFNIEPAGNVISFVRNIKTVKEYLENAVKEHNEKYKLAAVPVATFNKEYFHNVIPAEAKILGCDPDWNAYTLQVNPIPNNKKIFRTGSGHVHVGWTNGAPIDDPEYMEFCSSVVRTLDVYLGLPSLLWDKDARRRILYGKGGAFRPKHYGLEYRVLSNAWLNDDELIRFVFKATMAACDDIKNQVDIYKNYFVYDFSGPQRLINDNNSNWPVEYPDLFKSLENRLGPLPRR